MKGDELPNDGHVVRYVKPTLVDEEVVDGSAFVLRENENGLSVNWLEAFADAEQHVQLNEVRRLFRLNLSANGRFAKLKVGETKQRVSANAEEAGISLALTINEAPLPHTEEFEADPSHAEIIGVPPGHSDQAMLIGDLIAECIIYPLYMSRAD